MPTYEYECGQCGLYFERQQSINDNPVSECPECGGAVRKLISGGSGFILKGAAGGQKSAGGCSLETTGRTCCGATQRCGQSHCGD